VATKAKVKEEAAQMLGILRPGQSLNAPNDGKLDEYWTETLDELIEEELGVYPAGGPVQDRIKPHVAALIALKGTETFSITPARYNRVISKAQVAKREIRKLVTPKYESMEEPTDY